MRVWIGVACSLAVQAALSCATAAADTAAPNADPAAPNTAIAGTCADTAGGLGVSRVVNIDASAGPLYGDMTKLSHEDTFLGPKEVVLTFDDGPIPWITKSILDTLDRFCTKATFFSVGQMALAYPDYSKEVLARGHTLGAHTWSHPMNLKHLPFEKAKDQIERGFAAVALAAGQPIAPFFRFPGLNDSDPLLHYLQSRGIATFTVDVVSNDSYIASASRLTQRTLAAIEQHNGGIILFHDIKSSTTKALPDILKELQVRGYKVVHMQAKAPAVPLASYEAGLAPVLAKAVAQTKPGPEGTHQLRPFYGSATLLQPQGQDGPVPVTELAPATRMRVADVPAPGASRRTKKAALLTEGDDTTDHPVKLPRAKLRLRQVKKTAVPVSGTALFPF